MSLIDKLKAARQSTVSAGGYSFTIRRPTDMEVMTLQQQATQQGDILRRFVVDWSGVQEADIIPGGLNIAVAFETELFMEWVADQPALWSPLADAVIAAYHAHVETLGDELGKPVAG